MKIYTRSGDKGTTGLYDGTRVDKDDIRIECLGDIDEANSSIGLLRAKIGLRHAWQDKLKKIQIALMDAMSHVAIPSQSATKPSTPLPIDQDTWIENWIDEIEVKLGEPSEYFLLPGGTEASALCHVIRTQMRRAERRLISLNKVDPVEPSILQYINRLSDLFFNLSREALAESSLSEEKWNLFVYKKLG